MTAIPKLRTLAPAPLLVALLTVGAAAQERPPDCAPDGRGLLRACFTSPGAPLARPASLAEGQHLRWVKPYRGQSLPVPADSALAAPGTPGIWRLESSVDGKSWAPAELEVVSRVDFDGRSPSLNGYLIGRHPGAGRMGAYAPPRWFIEVTAENQDYAVSRHFKLRQFLTKDQRDVWPKYLPLDPRLVSKLELMVLELRREGKAKRGLHVMSGYRTPHYNGPGGKGRAKFSRHTYGDAADVWVDDDGDGLMDDLNGDGKVDDGDAGYLVELAGRVEQAHPELVGGAGIYKANRVRGPFTHIDVRGRAARWSIR